MLQIVTRNTKTAKTWKSDYHLYKPKGDTLPSIIISRNYL